MQNTDINWIEDAISKKYIKYYEYNHFSNFEKIGSGAFGIVQRANWKKKRKKIKNLIEKVSYQNTLKLPHEQVLLR